MKVYDPRTGTVMEPDEWQEYDCPVQGTDFDLGSSPDYPMVYDGDTFYCPICWGEHVATPYMMQEYRRNAAGDAEVVPLRKRETGTVIR